MGSGEENKQKASDINLGKTQSLKAFNTLFTPSCSDLSTCSSRAGGRSGTPLRTAQSPLHCCHFRWICSLHSPAKPVTPPPPHTHTLDFIWQVC